MPNARPRPNPSRTFVKRGAVAVASAGFAAIAIYLGPSGDDEPIPPPELTEEPDAYLEQGVITQFRDDGALHYRLRADRISHFDAAGSLLQVPVVELHDPNRPPWHVKSQAGEVRTVSGPSGEDEEQVELRGDVSLTQDRGGGAFTRIRTESLTLFPDRHQARSEQTAIIETAPVSARVAGFEADLANGRLTFFSSTDQRVSIVVQPDTQTASRR